MKKFYKLEFLKTILLISLFTSMCYLTIFTWVGELDFSSIPEGTINILSKMSLRKDTVFNGDPDKIYYPTRIMVRTGHRLYSTSYDLESIISVYGVVRDIFRYALEHDSGITPIGEEEYIKALNDDIIFCEYEGNIPISVVFGVFNLGIDNINPMNIFISKKDDEYSMYLRESETFDTYKIKIDMDSVLYASGMGLFLNSTAKLASEDEFYSLLLPESNINMNNLSYPVLVSDRPSFTSVDGHDSILKVLASFLFNVYTSKKYYEDDGRVQVFVESYRTIKIDESGKISFSISDLKGGIRAYEGSDIDKSLNMYVDLSNKILRECMVAAGAVGQYSLNTAYRQEAADKTFVTFKSSYDGIVVDRTDSDLLAKFEFKGNILVSAVIDIKRYSPSGRVSYLTPLRQAVSMIGGDNTPPYFSSIRYVDNQGEGKDIFINHKFFSLR